MIVQMRNLIAVTIAVLLLSDPGRAAPKILIDPALTTASDGGLVLTADESAQLVAQVEKSLKLAREILSRPQAQSYFKNRYRLNPIEMMDRDGWSITITAFPDNPNERPGEVECIGMYLPGEGRMAVDIRRVMLGPGYGLHETGTADVARTIVHEVAHWADDVKGGPTNDDRTYDREEGVLAQRACGCGEQTALRHHPWREELVAWRREAGKRGDAPRALPTEQGPAAWPLPQPPAMLVPPLVVTEEVAMVEVRALGEAVADRWEMRCRAGAPRGPPPPPTCPCGSPWRSTGP